MKERMSSMLQEQRLDMICDMMEYGDNSILLESVSYSIEDSNDIFNQIFWEYGYDSFVCEAGKIKDFLSKSRSAVSKLLSACKRLAEYLGSKIIQKIESGLKSPQLAKVKIKIPGRNPVDVQKNLNEGWKKIQKTMDNFKKQSAYNKAIIPVANAISWTLFPVTPGVTETILAVSSIGEFILDYKRLYLGQQYSAIKNFSDYIQNNMTKLDESTIYESDKIMQKILNFVDTLQGEIKRLTLAIDRQAFKGIEKGSKALSNASNKMNDGKMKEKVKEFSKKSETAAKQAKDSSKESLDKYKEYKQQKKVTKERAYENKKLKGDKSPSVNPLYMQGRTVATGF